MAKNGNSKKAIAPAKPPLVLAPIEEPPTETVVAENGLPAGIEVPAEDMFVLERVRLLQPVSNTEGLAGDPKPGMVYHASMGVPLWPTEWHLEPPDELLGLVRDTAFGRVLPLLAVPCWTFIDRVLFDEVGLACKSDIGGTRPARPFTKGPQGHETCAECPLKDWRGDQPPVCTEYLNVAALIIKPDGSLSAPVVFPFGRTSRRAGRRLTSQMLGRGVNPWQIVAGVWTVKGESTKGNYFRYEAAVLGYSPEPLAARARQEGERLMALRDQIQVAVTQAEDVFAEPETDDMPDEMVPGQ